MLRRARDTAERPFFTCPGLSASQTRVNALVSRDRSRLRRLECRVRHAREAGIHARVRGAYGSENCTILRMRSTTSGDER